MSKFKEMIAHYEKAQEISGSTTGLVGTTNQLYREEIRKLEMDQDLSDKGKQRRREEIQREFGDAFIKNARTMNQERKSSLISARTAAKQVINEDPVKPLGMDLKEFERNLSNLKLDVLLETNPTNAIKKLQDFVGEQENPYMAKQLLESFPEIAKSVLDGTSGPNTGKFKSDLQSVLTTVRSKAVTDEQRKAAEIYQLAENQYVRNLFLADSVEIQSLRANLGQKVASYANTPELYRTKEEETQQ
ncbi:hypothetical protein [Metabacillus sp. RGM 3146]|uniref:hypothetical protein n=1 Tax=Metabacillus sp. RGM 3146 TaxID=3401092 RepID=UPI003B99A787